MQTQRKCVHNKQKHALTNTSDTFQINQQQQACGTDKYENAYTQVFVKELS